MRLLLVGSENTLMRQLVTSAYKADWEVYLLTGKTGSARKPARVFEQFLFPYPSEAVLDVVTSVEPDIVLFMGLYDGTFDWSDLRKTTVDYLSGLANVLNACEGSPGLRFFYLSSQEVFLPNAGLVGETVAPNAKSPRGLLIEQGEALCINQHQLKGLDATIIRLDHPYAPVTRKDEYCGIIESMTLEACTSGKLSVPADEITFSGLYYSDAAEGIYRIMAAERRKQRIYHLSCDQTITLKRLAQLIGDGTGAEPIPEPDTPEPKASSYLQLDSTRARDEFGFQTWHMYDKTIPELCAHMRKHAQALSGADEADQQSSRKKRRTKIRSIIRYAMPYVLNALGATLAFWLDGLMRSGGYDARVDILLLYPLLFAGVYGKRQAILSSILSVVYAFLSAEQIFDMMINYNTYLWVAEVFIASMLVGHLRDTTEIVKVESEEEVQALRTRQAELITVNDTNIRIKHAYEKRVLEYNGSLGRIYKITSELEGMQPGQVMISALQAVADLMKTNDAAIYTVDNARYCRLFAATSDKARVMGNSLAYTELTEMYDCLRQHRVFINRRLDPSLPQMANAIFEGERMTFLLMVWGLRLENLTLYQANQLSILCFLIMMSLNHAATYFKMLEHERYIEGTRIMDKSAFGEMLAMYTDAKKKHLVNFALLNVEANGHSMAEMDAILHASTRGSDLVGQREDGRVALLLLNTRPEDAPIVMQRIENRGLSCALEGAVM